MSSVLAPQLCLRPPKEKCIAAGRWHVREMQRLCDRDTYIGWQIELIMCEVTYLANQN